MYYSHNLHFMPLFGDERQLSRGQEKCRNAGGARGASRENDASVEGFMTIPWRWRFVFIIGTKCSRCHSPSGYEDCYCFLALSGAVGFGPDGQRSEAEAEYKVVSDAEADTPPT